MFHLPRNDCVMYDTLNKTNLALLKVKELKPKSGWMEQTFTRAGFTKIKSRYLKNIYPGGTIIVTIVKSQLVFVYTRSNHSPRVCVLKELEPIVKEYILESMVTLTKLFQAPVAITKAIADLQSNTPVAATLIKELSEIDGLIVLSRLPDDITYNTLDEYRDEVIEILKGILILRLEVD